MSEILIFNKPYGVLSQFTDGGGRQTLADFISLKDYYAAGRLDLNSEGLLILTNDGRMQHHISDPKYKLPKTYWVQIEGNISSQALMELCQGVQLKDGLTRPAVAEKIDLGEDAIWTRNPPIRKRETIPTSWISLTIREGRNRQIRRMTAAVGLPTLRLIRYSIGDWTVDGLQPGEWRRG